MDEVEVHVAGVLAFQTLQPGDSHAVGPLAFRPVVDFLRPDPKQFAQRARVAAFVDEIVLVDDSAEVRRHERAASGDPVAELLALVESPDELFRRSVLRELPALDHVEHRGDQYVVLRPVCIHADDVDGYSRRPDRAEVLDGRLFDTLVLARPGRELQRPTIFLVPKDSDLRPGGSGADDGVAEGVHFAAEFNEFAEHPGLLRPLVRDDRAVELLVGAPAATPLKVHRSVGPVADRLPRPQPMHTRRFERVVLLPVGRRGGRLHEDPRLVVLHPAHQRVGEGDHPGVSGDIRVGVPRDHVHDVGRLAIVDAVVQAHQVRCDGYVGGNLAKHGGFVLEEVCVPLRTEPPPVQRQAVDARALAD